MLAALFSLPSQAAKASILGSMAAKAFSHSASLAYILVRSHWYCGSISLRSFNASDMADSPFPYGVFLSQSGKRSPLPSMQAPFILHRQTQYKSIIHQMLEKTNPFLFNKKPAQKQCLCTVPAQAHFSNFLYLSFAWLSSRLLPSPANASLSFVVKIQSDWSFPILKNT